MLSIMLKCKIHKATVTSAELDYEGSLTIDRDLMDLARIRPYEKILVANLANGARFETYAIPGEKGSKEFCLNGATAHRGAPGDRIIIFTFALVPEEELDAHHPHVVILDENNDPVGNPRDVSTE